jgi:hypothetical protein
MKEVFTSKTIIFARWFARKIIELHETSHHYQAQNEKGPGSHD